MRFYLGTPAVEWLHRPSLAGVPLFVSRRRLGTRKRPLRPAITRWALDSGGYSELDCYGEWRTSPQRYADEVQRWQAELGQLDWAATQDWMVEPWIVAKTGRSVREHQQLTVDSYLQLRELAPTAPWVPVVQGWTLDDYLHCVELYEHAGIELTTLPLVGVGSVCRRQNTSEAALIFDTLTHDVGLSCHAFGVKLQGLRRIRTVSADSQAWSYAARARGRDTTATPACTHPGACTWCEHWARRWYDDVLRALDQPRHADALQLQLL